MHYSNTNSKVWRTGVYKRKITIRFISIFTALIFILIKLCIQYFYSENLPDIYSYNKKVHSGRHLLGTLESPEFNCTPRAIANFPRDLFSDKMRRQGFVIFHVLIALYMFMGLAIVCDEYFVPCLECISKAMNLSPDVAGATFMAAGSSAPELATTMIGVFIAKKHGHFQDDIGLGAVVGSADYNVMFVISACALFAKSVINLNWWPLVRDCIVYMLCICLLAVIISDGRVYWFEALLLLICYAFYILLMYFNRNLDAFFTHLVHHFCPRSNSSVDAGRIHWEVGCESVEQLLPANPSHPNKRDDFVYTAVAGSDSLLGNGFHACPEDSNDIKITTSIKHSSAVTIAPNAGSRTSLVSSTDSVGELRLPQAVAAELDYQSTNETDVICYGCFGILSWPESNSVLSKFIHIVGFPLKMIMCLTTPDCRLDKFKSWFWLTFVMSCFWITVYSYTMIWMITIVGYTAKVPDTVMGLTFIAAGSSVPDVIASVIVVREGEGDMAVSNAVGSNIFDILVCMGFPWLIKSIIIQKEIPIYSKGLEWATLTLLSTVLILLSATHINRWRLTKPYGVFLMIIYLAFLVLCTLYELNIFGYLHPKECDYTPS